MEKRKKRKGSFAELAVRMAIILTITLIGAGSAFFIPERGDRVAAVSVNINGDEKGMKKIRTAKLRMSSLLNI